MNINPSIDGYYLYIHVYIYIVALGKSDYSLPIFIFGGVNVLLALFLLFLNLDRAQVFSRVDLPCGGIPVYSISISHSALTDPLTHFMPYL